MRNHGIIILYLQLYFVIVLSYWHFVFRSTGSLFSIPSWWSSSWWDWSVWFLWGPWEKIMQDTVKMMIWMIWWVMPLLCSPLLSSHYLWNTTCHANKEISNLSSLLSSLFSSFFLSPIPSSLSFPLLSYPFLSSFLLFFLHSFKFFLSFLFTSCLFLSTFLLQLSLLFSSLHPIIQQ